MNSETWDWDTIEELAPVPDPDAVVLSRFSLDAFARVSREAEAEGFSTSEYVKQSALMCVMHLQKAS
jgi:hypothetical protein